MSLSASANSSQVLRRGVGARGMGAGAGCERRRCRHGGASALLRPRRRSATCRCCTSPTATRSCCRSTFASRASTSASARARHSRRTWSASTLLKHCGDRGRHARRACVHLSRLRAGRAPLRQGRRLRAPRHAGQAAEGQPARRAAARRRRHLAGLGHGAVDARARTWSTPRKLLGVDVMTGHWEFTYGVERVKEVVEKDFAGKIDFLAQNVKTADFGDPVFTPYVIREINGVPVRDHRPGVPVHADRQPALLRGRLDASASRKRTCRRSSTRRAPRARRSWSCSSHNGMDVDLKLAVARAAASTRSSAATRTTACRRPSVVGNARRQDARHQRRQQRQVPRRARLRRQGRARSPTSATGCCRCSRTCCRPTRRWTR